MGQAGCAGSQMGGNGREASDRALALPLANPDGTPFDMLATRGRPLLLYLFATYDSSCQLALTPLTQFLNRHPELGALGIAVQPDPSDFLETYASSLALEFPVTYDPENSLLQGTSDLGRVEMVPTYVLLDAQGRQVAWAVGGLGEEGLEELLKTGGLR